MERHSTRKFLPQPVPREFVDEELALAQHAPSNSNIPQWHMVLASRTRTTSRSAELRWLASPLLVEV
ncbi:MAG: nitroreductase family protein [Candidatus Binatus sp.]